MHEGDEDLKREVVDLITEKWALSENWGLMHGIIAPGKDANLSSVIYSNLMRVKFHALGKLCKEALDMLGKATNEEEETVAQMVFLELKKEQAAIGKQLGIVIT
jgi:DNA primase